MLYSVEQSVLVIVDLQGNLAQAMYDKENLFRNVACLIKAAQYLEIPILLTEQVPEKIGGTVEEILSAFAEPPQPIAKETFSCWRCPEFSERMAVLNRGEVIICGIEAHVCVAQTAIDLMDSGCRVGCVSDAVSARTIANRDVGLRRIKNCGADLLCTEMIMTELLKTSAHPKFKDILKLIK